MYDNVAILKKFKMKFIKAFALATILILAVASIAPVEGKILKKLKKLSKLAAAPILAYLLRDFIP